MGEFFCRLIQLALVLNSYLEKVFVRLNVSVCLGEKRLYFQRKNPGQFTAHAIHVQL